MSLRFSSVPAPRRAVAFLALGLFALGACATHVQNTGTYVPPPSMGMRTLPPPHKVYVTDFVVDPATLKLDAGVRARLRREFKGEDPRANREELTREVQSAISDTLVQAIDAMGLKTELVAQGTVPPPGNAVIRGEIVKITAGNQTRRTLIGFGTGKSEITRLSRCTAPCRTDPSGYCKLTTPRLIAATPPVSALAPPAPRRVMWVSRSRAPSPAPSPAPIAVLARTPRTWVNASPPTSANSSKAKAGSRSRPSQPIPEVSGNDLNPRDFESQRSSPSLLGGG